MSLVASGAGMFTGTLTADGDGYIALQPAASDGKQGAARLIGLSVIPDNAPRVRITAPGKDREVVTTGSANVTVDDTAKAANRFTAWVEKHGGHPAAVARTRGGRGKSDPGILRIDFPAGSR